MGLQEDRDQAILVEGIPRVADNNNTRDRGETEEGRLEADLRMGDQETGAMGEMGKEVSLRTKLHLLTFLISIGNLLHDDLFILLT